MLSSLVSAKGRRWGREPAAKLGHSTRGSGWGLAGRRSNRRLPSAQARKKRGRQARAGRPPWRMSPESASRRRITLPALRNDVLQICAEALRLAELLSAGAGGTDGIYLQKLRVGEFSGVHLFGFAGSAGVKRFCNSPCRKPTSSRSGRAFGLDGMPSAARRNPRLTAPEKRKEVTGRTCPCHFCEPGPASRGGGISGKPARLSPVRARPFEAFSRVRYRSCAQLHTASAANPNQDTDQPRNEG